MELAAFVFLIVIGLVIVGIAVGYLVERNKITPLPPPGTKQGFVDGAMYAEESGTIMSQDNYIGGSKGSYNMNPFV